MFSMSHSYKFYWPFYVLKNSLTFYSITGVYHSLILISIFFVSLCRLSYPHSSKVLGAHLLPARSLRIGRDTTLLPPHDSMAFTFLKLPLVSQFLTSELYCKATKVCPNPSVPTSQQLIFNCPHNTSFSSLQ